MNPLFPPAWEPPVHELIAPGTASPRFIAGAIDIGAFEYRPAVNVSVVAQPEGFALGQNYPNPFNPKTVVGSELPVASNVKLAIYDLLGREVAVLVNERRAAGSYQDSFDGSGLASGVYICRMTAGKFAQSRRMLLLR